MYQTELLWCSYCIIALAFLLLDQLVIPIIKSYHDNAAGWVC